MTLSADAILAIPLTSPFKLFPRTEAERTAVFHELAKSWHPDRCGRHDVFAHISALKDAADSNIVDNTIELVSKDGKKRYKIVAQGLRRFELGTMVLCNNFVIFLIDSKHEDLSIRGLRQIGSVRFPDNRMKEQHARFIPNVEKVFTTETQEAIVVKKTPDVLLLRDIVAHLGAIDPKHVAWIVSSLLNLTCFYEVIGLCHNGLSLDTVFISPEHHAAFPIGGWWYAEKVGRTINALSPDVHALAPRSMLTSKKADHRLDLECIRAIARCCLGTDMTIVPKPFANFVRLPAPKSPIEDYAQWEKVLTDSFGPRRFLKLSLTSSDIY